MDDVNKKNMYNILLMIACYFTANQVYAPATPAVAASFGVSNELAKATVTLFQLGALASCVIAALFADYLGKKNFLLFGSCLAFAGTIMCMLAPSIYILLLGRIIQGFGAATGFMMGFALAVDMFEPKQVLRLVAINGVTVAMICVAAPYIGGTVAKLYSWRETFLLVAPLFLITVIVSYRHLPQETNIRAQSINLRQSLREVFMIIKSPRYLAFASLNGIFAGGIFFASTFLPFYYKSHFELPLDKIGLILGTALWLSFGVASIFSRWFNTWLHADYVSRLALTIILSGAALMLFTAWQQPDSLALNITALSIYCFGFGSIYAASITESMQVFLKLSTKASAIRTVLLTAGSFCGTFAALSVSDAGLFNLAYALLISASLGIFMFSIRGLGKDQ